MKKATHVSLVLARFDSMQETGPVAAHSYLQLLAGADVRSAATDPKSQRSFRFVVFGLHEGLASAEDALDRRGELTPWIGDATETWAGVFAPFRHFGEANFLDRETPGPLYETLVPEPPAGTPMAVMTSAGWSPNPDYDMERIMDFGAGVTGIRVGMTAVPGLHSQQTFAFPGGLEFDGITLTFWQEFAAMRDFAYGPGLHREMLRRQREETLADRSSFSRLIALRSEGTWHGRDPMAW